MTHYELLVALMEMSLESIKQRENPLIGIILDMAEPEMMDIIHQMSPEADNTASLEMRENGAEDLVAMTGKKLRQIIAECGLEALMRHAGVGEEELNEDTASSIFKGFGGNMEVFSPEELARMKERHDD